MLYNIMNYINVDSLLGIAEKEFFVFQKKTLDMV